MCKGAELVEEDLRDLRVVEEGGLGRVGRLVSFSFAFGGDGVADLGEVGCEVVRGVDEGGAGVTDGDAHELNSPPISSKGDE